MVNTIKIPNGKKGQYSLKMIINENNMNHNNIINNNNSNISNINIEDRNKFKREIGLLNAVAIIVGSIVGSGIFIAPKGIVSHVGSVGLSLIMWVFCGIVSLLGAFCFAELGTTFPSAGGQYTYIYEAFGPILAFLSLWSNTLIFVPIGNAILGLAFAKYVAQPFFPGNCEVPQLGVQLIAAAGICFLTFLNCCDINKTRKLLNGFLLLKITPLVVIIIGGIYSVSAGNVHNFENIWANSKYDTGSLVLASFSGSFAFAGWQSIISMVEELKNPNKNLPRGITISLILVTAVYLLTNAAYFAVLSPAEIISSEAVAVTFVENFTGFWGWIVPIFVSLSIFGTLSIHILTTSRACFVGSRCGQLPSFISLMTLSHKSPAPSAIFLSILSLLFLFSGDVFLLIEFGAITSGFFAVLTVAALMYLRWRQPDIERPFKISFIIPFIYFLVCLVLFIIPIYVKPITSGVGAILTLTGIPVYYLFISKDKVQSKRIQMYDYQVTIFVQKLLVAVTEDK